MKEVEHKLREYYHLQTDGGAAAESQTDISAELR